MLSIQSLVRGASWWLVGASLAGAQEIQRLTDYRPVEGPLNRVKYDVGTGQVTRLGRGRGFERSGAASANVQRSKSVCLDDSLTSGYYTGLSNGMSFMSFAAKQCNTTETITRFSFAYATTARDPSDVPPGPGASIAMSFYSGAHPFCEGLGQFEAYFLFTGLPGAVGTQVSPSFVVTATLGGNSVFNLPDGPIGWGYSSFEGPFGTSSASGPLLTEFSANTGWNDVFDIYNRVPASTGTCLGAFFFDCMPPVPPPPTGVPCVGLYLRLWEHQPQAGVAVFRNAGTNPAGYAHLGSDDDEDCTADGSSAGPVIGERWLTTVALPTGHLFSVVTIARNPLPGMPLGGAFGGTSLLCSGVIVNDVRAGAAPHCIAIPKDLNLIGATICTQGASGDPSPYVILRLNNALDVTFGVR